MSLFSQKMMFLNCTFNDSDELFDFVNDQAMKNGLVKDGFLHGIKEREKKYPTALPGRTVDIAVPHTDPEFIVDPFIAVVRCQTGIPFVQMGSDDKIIFPKLFFVLGFKKEGCEKYQVKALTLLIDYFITENEGKNAEEFMGCEEADCIKILFKLEQKLLGG